LHFQSKEKAEAKVKELVERNAKVQEKKKVDRDKRVKLNMDEIMKVIGTPEKNRETLIKALFLDMNMTCKSCNLTYKTGADLEQLDITKYCDVDNPNKLDLYLTCHCGHSGEYTFSPNPFIKTQSPLDPQSESYLSK
jgi:hypothetical protein